MNISRRRTHFEWRQFGDNGSRNYDLRTVNGFYFSQGQRDDAVRHFQLQIGFVPAEYRNVTVDQTVVESDLGRPRGTGESQQTKQGEAHAHFNRPQVPSQ